MEILFNESNQKSYLKYKDVDIYFDSLLKIIIESNINDSSTIDLVIQDLNIKVSLIKEKYYNIDFGITEPKLFLYYPVNLKINENTVYDIYSNQQYNNYIKPKFLEGKNFKFYTEKKPTNEIQLQDFYKYAGETIILVKYEEYEFDKEIINRTVPKKLKDLSLDYLYLFSQKGQVNSFEEEIFNDEERQNFENNLSKFYTNFDTYYKHYIGKRGVGKTVSFLNFRYKLRNILYINLKLLFHQNTYNSIIKILKNELIYVFRNENDYNSFINKYGKNIFSKPLYPINPTNFGFEILKKLIDSLIEFVNIKSIILLIIFDQYKSKYELCNNLAEKLEKKSNYYLKFITCSSINEKDIRNPIYNTIFKNENYNFEIITR